MVFQIIFVRDIDIRTRYLTDPKYGETLSYIILKAQNRVSIKKKKVFEP